MDKVDIDSIKGLSVEQAMRRLVDEGYNEIPSAKKRSIFRIAFEVIKEPMFLLLVACGSIYFFLGDVKEAAMLLGFVFFIMGITLYQERKTERALEALRDLSSPRALVIRDGKQQRIAGREVVREDIIVLQEGDRVPADAEVIHVSNLMIDESLLTGESVPVSKMPAEGAAEKHAPGGDNTPFIYSGTLIVQGQGIARVYATGERTEFGKIGKRLLAVETGDSPLKAEVNKLVRNLAIVGLSLCAVIVFIYGSTRGDWVGGVLAGITFAMAMLPEEFPVVFTIFLALGAWRISKKGVLTRNVPAVETLGSATVLCVDKTGTITQNRMTVSEIYTQGSFHSINYGSKVGLPEKFHPVVEYSVLSSHKNPFDPMEKAFRSLGVHYLNNTEHLHDDWLLIQQYPLSKHLMAISHVWQSPDGEDYVIAAKGAPESIMDLCHLNDEKKAEIGVAIAKMAERGFRVLGVARAIFRKKELPAGQHDFDFEFLGLMGLSDPVRTTVSPAVKECYEAGIRVIMITGDYPGTARAVGREIGLKDIDNIITGPELEAMGEGELRRRIQSVNIFSRVVPEQKLRIVEALKADGEVVAMTGDGVNDAPALKSAHIGVAMGERGTDVAREASSLVLTDDDFSSIVRAVRQGRRIFDNLKKAMAYIFAIHVPIAGMSLIPIVLGWPILLFPVHVVFLELIIDPACSIVFEAEEEEADVMRRKPRRTNEHLFGRSTMLLALFQGLFVLAVVLLMFIFSLSRGASVGEARALSFATLIVANLGLILANRSWTRTILQTMRTNNIALWFVLSGAVAFLLLAVTQPILVNLFHFSPLHTNDIFLCLAAGLLSVMWFEVLKMFRGLKITG